MSWRASGRDQTALTVQMNNLIRLWRQHMLPSAARSAASQRMQSPACGMGDADAQALACMDCC